MATPLFIPRCFLKAILIIPVYNHAASITRVIESARIATQHLPEITELILINDGCTDATPQLLAKIPNITTLTHKKNRGKGAALLTAFKYAQQNNFTHAITLDADGQHDPTDIPRLLTISRQHPTDLIIGWRDMDTRTPGSPLIPSSSKKGRDISRFWLRIQTGQDIPDSQCGLRIYPIANLLKPPYRFHRFDFETEVLARFAWGGVKIRSIPVTCIYFSKNVRVSHFRPFVDTFRGIRVNIFLVARRLLPLPFPRLVDNRSAAPKFGRWWKPAAWKAAFRNALSAGNSNSELATAFALGIFVGLTPFYFLQTILSIYLARRLHLHVIAALIGSQISIPPLAPLWFFLSYGTGNVLLHGRWTHSGTASFSRQMLPALVLGSLLIATLTSALSLLLARQILPKIRPNPVPTC